MPSIGDLVHQTSSSTGTGNLTVAAVNGKRSFSSVFSTGVTTNVFWYFIANQNAAEWEIGTGHMSDATTLVRDTVISSSNSNAAVNFSAGTKDITNDLPALNQLRSAMDAQPNRVINPNGLFYQAGLASTADAAYSGFDQWYCLTQSNPITPSQLTNVENGLPTMMRFTQANATAQRFGVAQPFETAAVIDMRGKSVVVSARVRMSASTTLRYALIEWTGTADTITKDVVNSWTNTTFTTGNFFISTTTTIVATGSTALSSNTLTDITLTGSVSSSMNNLILFFWTDSTQAQNVTLDVGKVGLYLDQDALGIAPTFKRAEPGDDLRRCQRFYAKTYPQIDAPGKVYGQPSGGGAMGVFVYTTSSYCSVMLWSLPATMRAAPSVTTYSPYTGASGVIRDQNGTTDRPSTSSSNESVVTVYVLGSSTPSDNIVWGHAVANARL